jgi:hypothetical protein
MPRRLFTTRVASASPSTSSATISQRTAGFRDLLEHRQQIADVRDLLVVQEDERVFQDGDLLVRVVDEVRGDVAAVELHALDEVELVLEALAVFHGDDAFLADLVHRFGDRLADLRIRVGGDRADLGDFLGGRARLGDLLQLLDRDGDRLVDAALDVHRVHAGGDVLHAFGDDRLREHGGGGGAVTGDVEVLEATSFTICAPMFSNLSLSSISFATDTPSLVTVGAPKERSRTTLRPFGPRVILTASARMFTPRSCDCARAL